jgi:ribosomal protein L11 methyltransferase
MRADETQRYHEIAVTVTPADADPVANYIVENICPGLLLEDDDEARTIIKFYVPDTSDIDATLRELARYLTAINPAYAGAAFGKKFIQSHDWIDAYKKSVTPILIGNTIVVKPPWNTETFEGRTEIIIEPKMAFGTGRHESTQGCLAQLAQIDLTGKRVLDVGCGSGILCIYAAMQGAGEVVGCDTDPIAVENSAENFILNDVASVCRIIDGGIEAVASERHFDVIVVNIIKSVILSLMDHVRPSLAPDGVLLLAGLLEQDRAEIRTALKHNGFRSDTVHETNGWLTFTGSPI